ncbi:hypothetical protein HK102_008724, partial [Quaeritorhiza haematococci]
ALRETLNRLGVKATFFINGVNWNTVYEYADLMRGLMGEGHQIASHTYTHCNLTATACDVEREIDDVAVAVNWISGKTMTYFRPPFGLWNDRVISVLRQKGYRLVWWNSDTFDTLQDHINNPQLSIDSVRNYLDQGNPATSSFILLAHDIWPSTVNSTEAIINLIRDRGYRFVTVA